MDPVGKQGPGKAAIEIDPETGAGEPGMPDGIGLAGVAAVPAGKGALPAAGAVAFVRGADFAHHRG